MIKITISEPEIKEKEYIQGMLDPLLIRIGHLKLSLKHLLEDSRDIYNNGIESYKYFTRKIIIHIEHVKDYGSEGDFNAPNYLKTIDAYLASPTKLKNFKIRELLDYLDELEKDNAKLLKVLLICPAEDLFDTNESITAPFNDKEVKILSLAINYGHDELSKAAKKFFRGHNFVHSCPYCNLENAKYKKGKKGTARRHQLDHFFSKAKFPLLALSMYNLVPCGAECNGPDLKGEISFTKEFHLNPYIDGFNEMVRFYPKKREGMLIKELGLLVNCPDKIRYGQILGDDNDKSKKGLEKGNVNVFELESTYGDKIDEAQDVLDIINKRVNGLKSISLFLDKMKGIDLAEAHKIWYKGEMKTFFEPENFHRKDLSKFKRDIHDYYILQDSRSKMDFVRNIIIY